MSAHLVDSLPARRQTAAMLLTATVLPMVAMFWPETAPGTRQTLHEDPVVELDEAFLTHEECDALIELSRSRRWYPDGPNAFAFFEQSPSEPLLASLERRLARWMALPVNPKEAPIKVAQRQATAHSVAALGLHLDINKAARRRRTVIMYCSDVEVGGATVFPCLTDPRLSGASEACTAAVADVLAEYPEDMTREDGFGGRPFKMDAGGTEPHVLRRSADALCTSAGAVGTGTSSVGTVILPRKGRAIMFDAAHNLTWHAGCSVARGTKQVALASGPCRSSSRGCTCRGACSGFCLGCLGG